VTYIEPALPLLLLLASIGAVRAWRSSEGRRPWFETIGIGGIWFLSMNAGAWVLSRPLEIWYSHDPIPQQSAEAIVVLSGTVNQPTAIRPYPVAGQDTYRRVQHAAWLFRNWKAQPILACGGGSRESPHAETMRNMLAAEGIPPEMIWLESRSRNTHESATYGSEVLRARGVSRIVLVTEASSMPRAAQSFRKSGLEVVPAPARYNRLNRTLSDFMPAWGPIASNGETIHELVGLIWYKLRGWI
jgi:uncharacterized SAM-binding protein YcdF (DUF218 family)